jgi:DNA-binding transcriptional regulator YiaG
MLIAQRLKEARKKCGFSQSDAATAWGLNPHTLQGWEISRHQPQGLARTHLEKLLADILDKPASRRNKAD